jgi:hypothetical protein
MRLTADLQDPVVAAAIDKDLPSNWGDTSVEDAQRVSRGRAGFSKLGMLRTKPGPLFFRADRRS